MTKELLKKKGSDVSTRANSKEMEEGKGEKGRGKEEEGGKEKEGEGGKEKEGGGKQKGGEGKEERGEGKRIEEARGVERRCPMPGSPAQGPLQAHSELTPNP